jgi:DNA-directed RNA polymerase
MTKDLDYGIGLLAEMLVRPRFEPEEVERELRQAIAERRQAMDDPSTLVTDQMMINLFKGHPYGHPTEGLASSLETITRDDVTRFYMSYWTATNAVLAIVGDVDPGKVKALVERTMMEWPSGTRNNETPPPPAPVQGRRVVLVSKPDATQTQIRLCQVGIDRRHADYFPAMVANAVLGSGFTSWLVEEIRVNRGLSYSASSRFEPYAVGGLFRISTFTKNPTTKETIEVALAQVYRLRSGELDSATLAKARNFMIGQYTMRLETTDAIAAALLDLEYYGQPKSWIEDYAQNIEAVTLEDVRRVAQEVFPYDDLLFVIVSDPASVQDQLAPFGSVETITPTQ